MAKLTIPFVSPIRAKSRQSLRTSHRAEKLTTAQSPILAGSANLCLWTPNVLVPVLEFA